MPCNFQQTKSSSFLGEPIDLTILRQFFWYVVLLIAPSLSLRGQDTLILSLQSDAPSKHEKFRLTAKHPNPVSAKTELRRLVRFLHERAYLAATIDTLRADGDTLHATLSVGQIYRWAYLSPGNVPMHWLENAGWDRRRFVDKPFSWREITRLESRLQHDAQENGYPFAVAFLDSLSITEERLAARLCLERGENVLFSPLFFGETNKKLRLSKRYLQQYLGIRPGEPYNEKRVRRVSARLRELPFLEEAKPAAVRFEPGRAALYLWLRPRKASRFDFILGIQPAPDLLTGRTRLNLTGNANIDLQNALGAGERIKLEWQQLRPGTQKIDVWATWPYSLGLPLGFDGHFHLFKRDSLWLDVAWDAGAQYLFSGGDYFRFFFKNVGTTLLNVDKQALLQSRTLPDALDVSLNSFGLEVSLQRLDYRFNPQKGYALQALVSTGFKQIRTNNLIVGIEDPNDSTFRFSSLYDSVSKRTVQYRMNGRMEGFIPLFPRNTLRLALAVGGIFPAKNLFRNELYRIGGTKLLRGFDEESLLVPWYTVGTVEYRLLTGPNSWFFAFGDFGLIETTNGTQQLTDFPIGFGVGLALETKAGIFGLTWALGRRNDVPVQFGQAKIHFGYVNLF